MSSDHLNKPLLGVGYALSAGLMLATMNMCAKLLSDIFNPVEITFYRNIIAIFLLIGLVVLWKKGKLLYKTERPYAQLIRSVVGTTGMFFCIWAVLIMPLSVATAFIFTAPLFVTLLSPIILKEKVGIIRMISTFIGFSGILLIAQPEEIGEPWVILVGLAAGFFNGLVALCLRWLGSSEHTVTTNFYFFLYGTIMTLLLFPFSGISLPPVESYYIILGLGVGGLASLILKTQGFRYGPASLISPISYTMIIWAVLFDYIFWQTTPTIYTLLGSGVIIGSNLFIIWREHRKNQEHLIEA